MNSSSSSRHFSESVIDTLVCDLKPSPGGVSQSQAEVLSPWKMWCRVRVSWRLEQMKLLTSEKDDDVVSHNFVSVRRKGRTTHDVLEVVIIAPKSFRYDCFGDQERVRIDLC